VLHENVLFQNRSGRENIALADPAMPMEALQSCAARPCGSARIHPRADSSYGHGRRRARLNASCGQRQRIAIARASSPTPQFLIFDEATSALDRRASRIIHQNIKRSAGADGSLVIAHRLSDRAGDGSHLSRSSGPLVEDGPTERADKTGGPLCIVLQSACGRNCMKSR